METIRYDASKGYLLLGDGTGTFSPLRSSGLLAQGNVKDLEILDIKGQAHLLVVTNDGPLLVFRRGQ